MADGGWWTCATWRVPTSGLASNQLPGSLPSLMHPLCYTGDTHETVRTRYRRGRNFTTPLAELTRRHGTLGPFVRWRRPDCGERVKASVPPGCFHDSARCKDETLHGCLALSVHVSCVTERTSNT